MTGGTLGVQRRVGILRTKYYADGEAFRSRYGFARRQVARDVLLRDGCLGRSYMQS